MAMVDLNTFVVKKYLAKFFIFALLFGIGVTPALALADTLTCPANLKAGPGGLCFPPDYVNSNLNSKSPGEIVSQVIEVLLEFAGIVAVIFIIYGGYVLMTSGGNEEGATKGKKILTYSLLGLVVIMLAYTIVVFVTNTVIKGRIGT